MQKPIVAGLTALALAAPAAPATWELAPTATDEEGIPWFQGPFSNALGQASREEQPLFVYFWIEGSDFCTRVFTETLSTAAGRAELAGMLCFSADAGHPRGARLVQRFGVTTLPTMLVLGADGRVDDAIIGYVPAASFAAEMQRIRAGQNTVGSLRRRLAEAPEDLQRRLDLAVKLQQVGNQDEAKVLLASIRERDPEGRTVVGAQLALWDVQNSIAGAATDPSDANTYDLAPMYAHVDRIGPEPIRFQAWDWLARSETARGERDKARIAYEKAWAHIPEDQVGDWGFGLVDLYWGMREQLSAADRDFVLSVATRVAEKVEALAELEPAARFGMDDERFATYHAETLDLLARAQFLHGERAAAVATLERALELTADDGELRARLESFRTAR
ncbi:MAG: hypothetical protein AAF682_25840 [Planctomycetota bacterium]